MVTWWDVQAEADAIRTVRPSSGGAVSDDIKRMVDVISDDININNGLIID